MKTLRILLLALATPCLFSQANAEAWKQEIYQSLQRRVSFEFVDTPLSEAVRFLQTVSGANIILDPQALEGNDPAITLKIENMNLDNALKWITQLAGLTYGLQDGVIFISTPDRLKGDIIMKIYDVSDLTLAITDFPGPDFALSVGGVEDVGGEGFILMQPDAEEGTMSAEDIVEMIRNMIPGWDDVARADGRGRIVVAAAPQANAKKKRVGNQRVKLEAQFLAVSRDLLDRLRGTEREEELTRMLQAALKEGKDASLSGGVQVSLRNGRSTRTIVGHVKTDKAGATRFSGTRADVVPAMASDRLAMAVNLRHTRQLGTKQPTEVFTFTTNVRCKLGQTVLIPGRRIAGAKDRHLIALVKSVQDKNSIKK
jgi:hypothetical protein